MCNKLSGDGAQINGWLSINQMANYQYETITFMENNFGVLA